MSGKADFNVSIVGTQNPKRAITTLPEFFLPSQDTKVSLKVMCKIAHIDSIANALVRLKYAHQIDILMRIRGIRIIY